MYTYKFRAECLTDVINAIKNFGENQYKLTIEVESPFPDAVVEMETEMSQEEIHEAMAEIEDGHVMLETLATKEEYTGER